METTLPTYHVISEVPDHWFPLLPEQLEDLKSVRLRLVEARLVDAFGRFADSRTNTPTGGEGGS